jgi:hypothetical protein
VYPDLPHRAVHTFNWYLAIIFSLTFLFKYLSIMTLANLSFQTVRSVCPREAVG